MQIASISVKKITVSLYLITHNQPHDTKGHTQLLDVSLSVWLFKCAKTSTAGVEIQMMRYIQFNLIHDRQSTQCGLLWPCLLKGNKRSILLKMCFTMPWESLSALTVVWLQHRCDSVGLKGNQFSWKSNSLAFSSDVTRIKHLYINIKNPFISTVAWHTIPTGSNCRVLRSRLPLREGGGRGRGGRRLGYVYLKQG